MHSAGPIGARDRAQIRAGYDAHSVSGTIAMAAARPAFPVVHLRVDLAEGVRIGPGKADLLEGIDALGSIAGAGRQMRMSYKRAWQLVVELNGCFDAPLVDASKGGSGGGGASLTPLGKKLLRGYRAMQVSAQATIGRDLAQLRKRVRTTDIK
jgi:molybdate transport system regulatory protein